MPTGKRYSKKTQRWETVDAVRPVDYSDPEQFPHGPWALLIGFFRLYPDIFLDILDKGTNAAPQFELTLIQRVMLREAVRAKEDMTTGPRGLSKTFSTVLASMVTGVLWPGTKRAYYAPSMDQAAELASEAFGSISERYPLLAQMWHVGSDAKASFRIYTDYGSELTITVRRGSNKHSVIAEECAQEDTSRPFDWEEFSQAVVATVRLKRRVGGIFDPTFPIYQKIYITSAGTQQNQAFAVRSEIFNSMIAGKNAFCMDVSYEVVVLSGIRDFDYYEDLRKKNTAEGFLRECCGIWTGTSENPVVRDSVLTESKTLMVMESRHCLDPAVIYVIGYDVSYADGAANAKCATAVLKLERQTERFKTNKYQKSFVYMVDEPPPKDALTQARRLKERWKHFVLPDGEMTYLAIDAKQYGKSVIEDLHKDLGDGMPPLCCMDHQYGELELSGALPVIYPINASGGRGGGVADSDMLMIQYAQREFEQGNVSLLTGNVYEGVKAYKALHRIKDDESDGAIAVPYQHTRDFCRQVSNLKTKQSGYGFREVRISAHIQRDKWSAAKYALHIAELLEHRNLVEEQTSDSEWKAEFEKPAQSAEAPAAYLQPRAIGRIGGNRR